MGSIKKYIFLLLLLATPVMSQSIQRGDLLYYDTLFSKRLERLHIGTTGQVLTVISGLPSWQDVMSSGDSLAIGSHVRNGNPFSVLFNDGSGNLSQDTAFLWESGGLYLTDHNGSVPNILLYNRGNHNAWVEVIGKDVPPSVTSGTGDEFDAVYAQSAIDYNNNTTGKGFSLRVPRITTANYTLTWPSAHGTAGQVLTDDGTGVTSWTTVGGSGSGLINWTDSINTAAPNDVIPAIAFVVKTDSVDADAVIQPKGQGGILSRIPDGTGFGGNKRGINSVDLQTSRSRAASVAAGNYSVISGGDDNKTTADFSTIGGGTSNTAQGYQSSILGGSSNFIGADYCAIGGGYGLDLEGLSSFGFQGYFQGKGMQIADTNVAVFGNVDLWLANNDTSAKAIKFFAPKSIGGAFPNGTFFTGLKSSNAPDSSVTYSLPPHDGSNGQFLKTDGAGNLSFATVSGGSGTVTSVSGSGGTTGLTLTGGPITTSGTLTLGGTLGVANGGTGAATFASNGVLYGNGTGAIQALAVNSSGTNKFLTQSSSGAPAWATILAGDVPNLDASILTAGTLAAARMPALTGDVTTTVGTVATTIANNAVTTAKILNSNVTLAKIANINDQTILGNNTGGSAAPVALTAGQTMKVIMPDTTGNTSKYLDVKPGGGFEWTTTGGGLSGLTNKGAVYATGTTTATSTGAMGDGQLLIGSSSGNPALGTLTAGDGISVTNGSNSVTLASPMKWYGGILVGLDSNSTAEDTIIAFTMGANDLGDSDVVHVTYLTLWRQSTGSTTGDTLRFYWGSNKVICAALSVTNTATTGENSRLLDFWRVGSDIWITNTNPSNSTASADNFATSAGGKLLSQTFTSATRVALTIKHSTANGAFWVRSFCPFAMRYRHQP